MPVNSKRDDEIRKSVRENYAKRATSCKSGCGGSCCSESAPPVSKVIGYSDAELRAIPQGADLGLGCGHPTALASLEKGEVVLDLGSGAGIDCFLAADKVGEAGRAIGVDMTPEMIERARENARKEDVANVEFRLGEIEHLPIADASVDVVISNCVINLSPDKPQVFREAFRALRPGGRLLVSDIVLRGELPQEVLESMEQYVGCVAGASQIDDYLGAIRDAGFRDVTIVKDTSAESAFSCGEAEKLGEKGTLKLVVDGQALRLEDVGLTDETAHLLAATVSSICVSATKP
ncbi:MAG: arsenite methyltransferase [Candidatus Bipolaricaulota bacterium]|nr:arsenite methyltransferase [Candidatus Bipolaricaulota bacterium]